MQPRRPSPRPHNQLWLILSLAALAILVGGIFNLGTRMRNANNIVESDPVLRGERLYQESCMPCHGLSGIGQPGPGNIPSLNSTGIAMRLTDGEIQRLVLERGQSMPAYDGVLRSSDVADIIRYLHTLWTPEQLVDQQSRSQSDPLK